jgi:hypothetical protein
MGIALLFGLAWLGQQYQTAYGPYRAATQIQKQPKVIVIPLPPLEGTDR